MTSSPSADSLIALRERLAKLERSVESSTKKAALTAVIAALLGSGGVAGVLQLWTGTRLRDAEAALKEQEATNIKREEQLKQDSMSLDVALKQQQHQAGEIDLKMKGLAQYKEEFDIRMKQHKAATESLEREIGALEKSGDSKNVAALIDDLRRQNDAFLRFFEQTRAFVQQLPGAPSWYQGVVQQVSQETQQHGDRLKQLSAGGVVQP